MMKIPDLSKIDIKDIDVNKIKDQVIEQKELAIQIGIGVVTFFMIVSMLNGSFSEVRKYKNQIKAMGGKSPAIEQYKKSQADIETFLKGLPSPLNESQIITLVTDMADKNKVKILTFLPLPPKEQSQRIYEETAIQFTLQTAGFKNLVSLIADIENSKNMLHVKSCTIQATPIDSGPQELNFKVEVASLKVKKEE